MSPLDAAQQVMLALLGSGAFGAVTLSVHLDWAINRCLDCLTALEVFGRLLRVSGGDTAVTQSLLHTAVPSGAAGGLAVGLASGVRCGPLSSAAQVSH